MARIPPAYLDCVVALGHPSEEGPRWTGSGFLYLHVLERDDEGSRGRSYVVTNRHVVEDFEREAVIGFNPIRGEAPRDYRVELAGTETSACYTHPDLDVDVAVIPVNSQMLPYTESITGTSSHQKAHLIGLVSAYLPYSDVAVSVQTKKPRVIFEENSGLAEVVPVDRIEETIAVHLAYLAALHVEPDAPPPQTAAS